MTDICCIFNFYAHYREPIYQLMDKELGCDFYLGDKYGTKLKPANYEALKGFKGYLSPTFGIFHRFKGAHKAVMNRQYRKYIAIGDPYCISIWWLLIWSRLTGKKTVLWTHGWYRDGNWVQNILYALFWRLPNHIMPYGNYARNHMIEKGINPNKMTCIYNSLDYDAELKRRSIISEDVIKKHFGNDYPVLFFIGRLLQNKRLDLIISAMKILEQKYEMKVNCVFIGDGPDKDKLIKLIEENQLMERVWFYGACYDEDEISQLINHSDLCVSPGNIGLTAIHSLTYGSPIITSDDFAYQMPEFEVVQPGVTGNFYKHNNVEDLAKTIYDWLTNVPDRETLRQTCYKVIDEKWNPYYQIGVIKEILKNL